MHESDQNFGIDWNDLSIYSYFSLLLYQKFFYDLLKSPQPNRFMKFCVYHRHQPDCTNDTLSFFMEFSLVNQRHTVYHIVMVKFARFAEIFETCKHCLVLLRFKHFKFHSTWFLTTTYSRTDSAMCGHSNHENSQHMGYLLWSQAVFKM